MAKNIEIRIDGDIEIYEALTEPEDRGDPDSDEYGDLGSDHWGDSDVLYRPDGTCMYFTDGPTLGDVDTIILATEEYDEIDERVLRAFYANRAKDAAKFPPLQQSDARYSEVLKPAGGGSWHDGCQDYAKAHGVYVVAYRGGVGYGYSITLIDPRLLPLPDAPVLTPKEEQEQREVTRKILAEIAQEETAQLDRPNGPDNLAQTTARRITGTALDPVILRGFSATWQNYWPVNLPGAKTRSFTGAIRGSSSCTMIVL